MRIVCSTVLTGLVALALTTGFIIGGCTPTGGTGGSGLGTPSFNLPPTVVLTADVQRGVAPLTVRFSSSGSSDDGVIVERIWDFDDGQTSREISPTHTFLETGTYTVRLTLEDDTGETSTRAILVQVTERPVAVIDVDSTSAESPPATFNFDGSASFDPDAEEGDVLLYRWDFDDGSSELLPTVAHTFGTAGIYRVRLTVTDESGVTGTAEKFIEVGIPQPSITFRTPPSELANLTVSPESNLWVHAVYNVEPGVPRVIRAGLDGDSDPCEAQAAVYNTQTGELLLRLSGHDSPVRAARFSPDGTYVLTASDDGTARLHDADTGDLVREYTGSGASITAVDFAPNGRSFASGLSNNNVELRDVDSNNVLRLITSHDATVNSVAFSPDGNRLVSADNDGVVIVSEFDGTEVARLDHGGRAVDAVAFSPTNARLVATACADQLVRLWDVQTASLVRTYTGHTNAVSAVAFSPDGSQLLSGSDDSTAKVWNLTTGEEIRTLSGHRDRVTSVAYSSTGDRIITGSTDDTARVWEAETGAFSRSLEPCASSVSSVAFAPGNSAVAVLGVAAQNDIRLNTNPTSGGDLDLTIPTALDLSDVPGASNGRQYFLWAEIDTDRTDAARTYAATRISVVTSFTTGIDNFTPRVPLVNSEAAVVTPATGRRQVFDLGPVNIGDRLILSLMTTPGYGRAYQEDGYSLLLLDAQEKLFIGYDDRRMLFSADSKIVMGRNSNNLYFVCDTNNLFVPSVFVRVERNAFEDSQPRSQYIYLDFEGGEDLSIGGFDPVTIAAWDPGDAVKLAIQQRVEAIYAGYDFTISLNPPAASATPFHTIYFDAAGAMLADGGAADDDLMLYGIPGFIDPRNETATGEAIVVVSEILNDFPGDPVGTTVGNAVAHQVGLLSGLRETTGNDSDIMTADSTLVNQAGLSLTTSSLAPIGTITPIGTQDAPQLMQELFGQ